MSAKTRDTNNQLSAQVQYNGSQNNGLSSNSF